MPPKEIYDEACANYRPAAPGASRGTLDLFLMNGTNLPAGEIVGTVGTEWRMVAAGDVNGDGRADMVFRRTDGTLSVFLMNGAQILSAELLGQAGIEWESCYGQPPSPAP
jgi:FG-GAP-like repeat